MNVAVTGGAGFLGRHVVDELRRCGHSAVVIDRRVPNWTPPEDVSVLTANIRDAPAITVALRSCEAIIHAAFAPPYAPALEQERVNADGVEVVCRAALDVGIKRFIMVSSTIVDRRIRRHPLSDRLPMSRLATYARTRAVGESRAAGTSGLSVGIARPRTLVGDGGVGAFALQFRSIAAGRPVIVFGDATTRYQLLDVADFADALVRFVESDHVGIVEFGASDVRPLVTELGELIAHGATSAEVVHVPAPISRAILTGGPMLGLRPLSEIYEAMVGRRDVIVDNSPARDAIGWSPRRSNIEALTASYDWFLVNQSVSPNHPIPWSHRLGLGAIVAGARVGERLRRRTTS